MPRFFAATEAPVASTFTPLPLELIQRKLEGEQSKIDANRTAINTFDNKLNLTPIPNAPLDVNDALKLQTDFNDKVAKVKLAMLDPELAAKSAVDVINLAKHKQDLMTGTGQGAAINARYAERAKKFAEIDEKVKNSKDGSFDEEMARYSKLISDQNYIDQGQYGGGDKYHTKSYLGWQHSDRPAFDKQAIEYGKDWQTDKFSNFGNNPNNTSNPTTTNGFLVEHSKEFINSDDVYSKLYRAMATDPRNQAYFRDVARVNQYRNSQYAADDQTKYANRTEELKDRYANDPMTRQSLVNTLGSPVSVDINGREIPNILTDESGKPVLIKGKPVPVLKTPDGQIISAHDIVDDNGVTRVKAISGDALAHQEVIYGNIASPAYTVAANKGHIHDTLKATRDPLAVAKQQHLWDQEDKARSNISVGTGMNQIPIDNKPDFTTPSEYEAWKTQKSGELKLLTDKIEHPSKYNLTSNDVQDFKNKAQGIQDALTTNSIIHANALKKTTAPFLDGQNLDDKVAKSLDYLGNNGDKVGMFYIKRGDNELSAYAKGTPFNKDIMDKFSKGTLKPDEKLAIVEDAMFAYNKLNKNTTTYSDAVSAHFNKRSEQTQGTTLGFGDQEGGASELHRLISDNINNSNFSMSNLTDLTGKNPKNIEDIKSSDLNANADKYGGKMLIPKDISVDKRSGKRVMSATLAEYEPDSNGKAKLTKSRPVQFSIDNPNQEKWILSNVAQYAMKANQNSTKEAVVNALAHDKIGDALDNIGLHKVVSLPYTDAGGKTSMGKFLLTRKEGTDPNSTDPEYTVSWSKDPSAFSNGKGVLDKGNNNVFTVAANGKMVAGSVNDNAGIVRGFTRKQLLPIMYKAVTGKDIDVDLFTNQLTNGIDSYGSKEAKLNTYGKHIQYRDKFKTGIPSYPLNEDTNQ